MNHGTLVVAHCIRERGIAPAILRIELDALSQEILHDVEVPLGRGKMQWRPPIIIGILQ